MASTPEPDAQSAPAKWQEALEILHSMARVELRKAQREIQEEALATLATALRELEERCEGNRHGS